MRDEQWHSVSGKMTGVAYLALAAWRQAAAEKKKIGGGAGGNVAKSVIIKHQQTSWRSGGIKSVASTAWRGSVIKRQQ